MERMKTIIYDETFVYCAIKWRAVKSKRERERERA